MFIINLNQIIDNREIDHVKLSNLFKISLYKSKIRSERESSFFYIEKNWFSIGYRKNEGFGIFILNFRHGLRQNKCIHRK